jgi:hypothetical protein
MIAAAIERCAGIDVGKKFLAVCIMVGPLEGEPRIEIRRFGTTVAELKRLPDCYVERNLRILDLRPRTESSTVFRFVRAGEPTQEHVTLTCRAPARCSVLQKHSIL